MQLRGIALSWTIAVLALGFLRIGYAQVPGHSSLVQSLEGHTVPVGDPQWEPLRKLLIQSFPDSKRYMEGKGTFYVWRIRTEDLVFEATDPISTDGASSAGFYWFDLHGTPLAGKGIGTGSRFFYQTCSVVSVPGVSSYVVETKMTNPVSKPLVEDFGFDIYRPILLRYAEADGTPLQNPYCTPAFACGPKAAITKRSELLEALTGANPLLQLEALTWLVGNHSALTADIVTVEHEAIIDSMRYWSLSSDSDVSQAASALASSPVPWIAQAAKYYVSVNKPQPVPNQNMQPILKSLSIKNVHLGQGGDFDSPDRAVKEGDRVVIEYQMTLANGVNVFSDFDGDANPAIFEVGSNQVIQGLSTGVIGMKVGGVRLIEIPARQAFGDAGADVVPPGADLTYKVRLLHIATEPPFGDGSERVLKIHEMKIGKGTPATLGATVKVSLKAYRLDGRPADVAAFSGVQEIELQTGSQVKKALAGMRVGGRRRLLVNFPSEFGQAKSWFHYSAQILEVDMLAIRTGG